jgi:hypothetical protein
MNNRIHFLSGITRMHLAPSVRGTAMHLSLFLAILLLSACDRTREDKGYEYFPDMAHSPAYQTYSANPAMEDGKTMREPVKGTIPRDRIPYPYSSDFDGRAQAGMFLEIPFEVTEKVLEEGQNLYKIFCSNCHGINGDGQGNLYTSGKYIIPPTSLLDPEIAAQPSGEIFHVISAGWGVMGAHASLIPEEDRWKIVAFIENILQEK